jgi:hypothetical protein
MDAYLFSYATFNVSVLSHHLIKFVLSFNVERISPNDHISFILGQLIYDFCEHSVRSISHGMEKRTWQDPYATKRCVPIRILRPYMYTTCVYECIYIYIYIYIYRMQHISTRETRRHEIICLVFAQ